MTEIKVQCECGQRFKFDVEPVHGLMPFTVSCPNCGADGTEKANAILRGLPETGIAQSLAADPASAPEPAKLRLSAPAQPPPSQPPRMGAPAMAAADQFSQPPTRPPLPTHSAGAAASAKPAEKSNFLLGTVGAVAAGFLGMLAWYFLIKVTGYAIGYAAWGVGVLTGAGARTLSGDGSTRLGMVAGVCAFLAIVGGQYLYVKSAVDNVVNRAAASAYESRLAYAGEAATVQTDDEVKALLARHEEGKQPTAEDIKAFREEELPKLKELSQGKPSKAEFENRFKADQRGGIQDSLMFKLLVLKDSLGWMTILFLFLGVSSAYKLGASKFGTSQAK